MTLGLEPDRATLMGGKCSYHRSLLPLRPLNSLSPYSDQHQFSPYNIHTLLREMVVRINKLITCEKCFDLLSNSLNYSF